MECQYVATQRGGVALVFEGHRYNKVRDGKDGTVYWRCSRDRQCPGRAVTVNNRVKKANNKHNHPAEAALRNGGALMPGTGGLGLGVGSGGGGGGGGTSSVTSAGSTGSSSAHSTASSSSLHPLAGLHHLHHHQQQQQHHSANHHHHHRIQSPLTGHHVPQSSVAHNETNNNNHRQGHHRLPADSLAAMTAAQEALGSHQSTMAAAMTFPSMLTETLKYLAAASGNPQMAAAFASSIVSSISGSGSPSVPASSSLSPSLKNLDRIMGLGGHFNPMSPSALGGRATGGATSAATLGHHRLMPPSDFSHHMSNGGDTDSFSDCSDDQPLNMAVRSPTQLVKRLRTLMKNSHYVPETVHAYIIPSGDSHQSEYIAACDARRSFVSGFDGSAGTAIVTLEEAGLWTDGRYHLQAERQLDPSWLLMKEGLSETPTMSDWLCKQLPPNSRVGADPFLLSGDTWNKMSKELDECGHSLVAVDKNLVDLVWDDRPPPPSAPIVPLAIRYTGKSWQDKMTETREEMAKKNASALVITALDEVAYLFNLRGSDIDYNPVFFAYGVLTRENIYLFVDDTKLTPLSRKHLQLDVPVNQQSGMCIELRPYKMVKDFLKWLVSQEPTGKIWISNKSSFALVSIIPESRRVSAPNPVLLRKAIKNQVELDCMRRAHIKDAVALCEFFAWLEEELNKGQEVTEISAADKLEEFRKTQEDYMGLSFDTISSSGPNGAIIHYSPTEATNRVITKDEMFLCDSGGQYCDGTTDVTRTMHFGAPSDYQKECFTRVVKGHIALARQVFPNKTTGNRLDAIARQHLWQVGLDYGHGTGHGVGMYLNVHEGPTSIGFRPAPDDPGLQEGMILSNEPGYYEDGSFGIRIESLVAVEKAESKYNFRNQGFLAFDTITLVPIQTKLLDPTLLTRDEVEWLDKYHETCRDIVGAALEEQGRKAGLSWLLRETQSLG
ncbi:Xaa-Pro aminopeptidase 1 [Halotydeus destructor]|nr:Xaa-Pro aminopeptidase 1 [Halotydeus destructor]